MSENKIKLPELLSPAGSPESLKAAVAGGADAVYFGAKSFSARSFAENFDDDAVKNAVRYCRALGVKTYMTVNVQLCDRELGAMELTHSSWLISDLLHMCIRCVRKSSFTQARRRRDLTFFPQTN